MSFINLRTAKDVSANKENIEVTEVDSWKLYKGVYDQTLESLGTTKRW